MTEHRICAYCVMDTSEPSIAFDGNGRCNHCREMSRRMQQVVRPDPAVLSRIAEEIKAEGRGKTYDCIIGVSGGVDSTYLVHLARELGLRPLAVHVDNGWNTELAVANIVSALDGLGVELHSRVLDWEEFRDLQVAFLRASVPDVEIPTDHAVHATLFEVAAREGVRHVLQGMNMRTEGIMPTTWSYGAFDWTYIKGLHARFGTRPLKDFPRFTHADRVRNVAFRRLKVACLLNYIDYQREETRRVLCQRLGWRDYGGKHSESVYTRFVQNYLLPVKFGIDKRRAHESALVVSGQRTRQEALEILARPACSAEAALEDREYVIKKLRLTSEEFDRILAAPRKTHHDYPNSERMMKPIRFGVRVGRRLGLLRPQAGL